MGTGILVLVLFFLLIIIPGVRIINQYERGVVQRLGRFRKTSIQDFMSSSHTSTLCEMLTFAPRRWTFQNKK